MNIITKKVRKTLRAMAKSLPQMFYKKETVLERVSGSTLIESGITESKSVSTVVASKSYAREIPKEVNHAKELEKAYIKLGKIGVFQYCQSIHGIANPVTEVVQEEVKEIA